MLTLLASVSSVLTTIGNLLLAFVVLMIMITIHEFGHYTAGKLLKFRINEFSIGMGPKIFSKTKKGLLSCDLCGELRILRRVHFLAVPEKPPFSPCGFSGFLKSWKNFK